MVEANGKTRFISLIFPNKIGVYGDIGGGSAGRRLSGTALVTRRRRDDLLPEFDAAIRRGAVTFTCSTTTHGVAGIPADRTPDRMRLVARRNGIAANPDRQPRWWASPSDMLRRFRDGCSPAAALLLFAGSGGGQRSNGDGPVTHLAQPRLNEGG